MGAGHGCAGHCGAGGLLAWGRPSPAPLLVWPPAGPRHSRSLAHATHPPTPRSPPTSPPPHTKQQAFDDIDGLLEGPEGFDSSSSVWHQTGWREVAALRKKLEDLRELRELVRQLGRGGGKGPLKKAPEQVGG